MTIGIILIGLSFYSIGSVLCNELMENLCIREFHTGEHYYTVLPYFLVMVGAGIILLAMGIKSISLMSFNKA